MSVISAGSFTSERLNIAVVCCGQKKYLNWEGHPKILVLNGETPNWKGSTQKRRRKVKNERLQWTARKTAQTFVKLISEWTARDGVVESATSLFFCFFFFL